MNLELGTRLKVARAKSGISQEHLGNLLGVSRITLHRWESGLEKPNPGNLRRLQEFLKLKPVAIAVFAKQAGIKNPRKNARVKK